MLKISVNGEAIDTSAKTLAELCDALGYGDAKIATALNGVFVAAALRRDTALSPDDKIEIVAPRQGG
ncbi:MAG: sulfur carrier protein ThiS [Chitinophagales bacterium]|nr:sulfur carrier protein ThiS [Hyphomicrobiales bacterium]